MDFRGVSVRLTAFGDIMVEVNVYLRIRRSHRDVIANPAGIPPTATKVCNAPLSGTDGTISRSEGDCSRWGGNEDTPHHPDMYRLGTILWHRGRSGRLHRDEAFQYSLQYYGYYFCMGSGHVAHSSVVAIEPGQGGADNE